MSDSQLSVAFFFQMFFILAVCRVVGALSRRLGQPQVVGEMIAGVLIGPSFFGFFFPHLQQRIFPPESLKILYVGAQLGVGLYMFLVGVEFNTGTFLSRARSAASVAIAGMIAPFVLGAALAIPLLKNQVALQVDLISLMQKLLDVVRKLSAGLAVERFHIDEDWLVFPFARCLILFAVIDREAKASELPSI